MDVANLPSAPDQSSTSLSPLQLRVAELLGDGIPHTELARRLGKGNKKATRNWRIKIRRWATNNPEFQAVVAAAVRGEAILNLPLIGQAMGKRALRGRTDAAKLAMEVTGFHNPRVKHEHSGDIKITLDIPRPGGPGKSQESQPPALDIPEADVVEDEAGP